MGQANGDGPAVLRRSQRGDPGPEPVTEERRELLAAAVELGVDPEDVNFRSAEERRLWYALEQEFEAFVAKVGPVWVADRGSGMN